MSTSKLQRQVSELLSVHLGQHTIRENTRPDWLVMPDGARLELDFYIEELQAAIEVQGAQHYVYVPHFHQSRTGFEGQLQRDRRKRMLCQGQCVELYEVSCFDEAIAAVEELGKITIYAEPHPNAIKKVRQSMSSKKPKKARYKHNSIYPKTINRHLARIYNAINTIGTRKAILEREIRMFRVSLAAIEQYQRDVGAKVEFDYPEENMLFVAQSAIEMVDNNKLEDGEKLW